MSDFQASLKLKRGGGNNAEERLFPSVTQNLRRNKNILHRRRREFRVRQSLVFFVIFLIA